MDLSVARRRVVEARIARLGTVTSEGRPHLVPCCFALRGEVAYTAVDAKPKSTLALRRIDNILAHGAASLLVDFYDEDWSALWWIRLDGVGRLIDSPTETEDALQALLEKYPQYGKVAIPGPFIAIDIETWRTWP
jgi:PPOX class probable F420-dependent enzyme